MNTAAAIENTRTNNTETDATLARWVRVLNLHLDGVITDLKEARAMLAADKRAERSIPAGMARAAKTLAPAIIEASTERDALCQRIAEIQLEIAHRAGGREPRPVARYYGFGPICFNGRRP